MAEVLSPTLPDSPALAPSPPRASSAHKPAMSGHYNQASRPSSNRSHFTSNSMSGPGHRSTPAAPTYAFKTTPHLRTDSRTTSQNGSAPTPQPLSSDAQSLANRQRYPAPNSSISTTSSSASSSAPSWSQSILAKDDSVLNTSFSLSPFTTSSNTNHDLSNGLSSSDATLKSQPNRYHRGVKKTDSSTSTIRPIPSPSETDGVQTMDAQAGAGAAEMQQVSEPAVAANAPAAPSLDEFPALQPSQTASSLKRYKRRGSMGPSPVSSPTAESPQPLLPSAAQRPASSHSPHRPSFSSTRNESGNGPARTFADVAKRTNVPSPLSRPPVQGTEGASRVSANHAFQNSPAVAAMAAISERDAQRGVKSKFRRAFSFGSSAEMKRVTEPDPAAERAKLKQEQFSSELDEEQEAIAKQQTEAGLGNNIYSGQAGFTGSTDNLSISSTASSASLMLRKMGRGMKKGGRSIKGLFRPKSVIGVPPADGPALGGQISFVTVEAEREKINVNADVRDQHGGGTGFPRLERNSLDAARASQMLDTDNADARKSILGGEGDRQEALASVKRGILKRNGTASSAQSPPSAFANHGNASFERQSSPAPSAGSHDNRLGSSHRRNDAGSAGNNDYFGGVPLRHANNSSRSLPGTPKGIGPRNISFSPRLQFFDVWSAIDYDRRGEIATCNRLTPMLAQQIKEELNNFKMEMEVHEMSKPHTHFF